MGMRISGPDSAAATQSTGAAGLQQRQQGVKDLMSALTAGNLSASQTAFASLPGAGSEANVNSPLGQIGAALKAGNLQAAQQAGQSWQTARSSGGGHHHHHGGGGLAATSPSITTPTTAAAGTGSLPKLTA